MNFFYWLLPLVSGNVEMSNSDYSPPTMSKYGI